MNVLVITRNAWDDTNSIGNTMSNFFGELENVNTANIYFRSSKPNNRVCKKYFHVTEQQLIRNLFSPEKCGSAFEYEYSENKTGGYSNEKKLISVVHRFGLKGAYALSENLWNQKKWLNKKLDAFVEEFAPDVVFSFAKSLPQYYHILKYLHDQHKLKIALWIADDEYTALSQSQKKSGHEKIERLRELLCMSDKVWGCSREMCEFYNSVFGCNAEPLYKSCSFDYPVRKTVNDPVRILYAGNLLFGRLEALKKLISGLKQLNAGGVRARLEIYSSTPLSEQEQSTLSIPGIVSFNGVKPYEEIKRLMSQSDLVLHIESFEEREIKKTKYSFSTKIIDCLQSGSVMLAIGPEQLASVRYAKDIPGAYVIDSEEDIISGISSVINDSGSFPDRAAQIRSFAEKNHSKNDGWLLLG